MTQSEPAPVTPRGHAGLDRALAALAAVLLVTAVVGGVLAREAQQDRAEAAVEQERYAAVLTAARAEAEAFVNIRYDDADAGIDELAAGATGELRERYTSSRARVIETLTRQRSVMEGEVVYAGVAEVDRDRATVLVATTGTVATRQTDNEPVSRDFRLRLELVHEGGRWLTSDLQIVS